MSTQTRKYELKARAASQRETRDRIAEAAAHLHEEKGVAATTVAEIARRAEVSRLTVYNHFADLAALLPACSAHYMARHPVPDFAAALALEDSGERAWALIAGVYGWYREVEPMFGKLLSERASVPELDRFMEGEIDLMQSQLTDGLLATLPTRGRRRKRLQALIALALDFWTWHRLSLEGLDDDDAAELLSSSIVAYA